MGRITETLPLKLSDVKSGYGVAGTRTLREFIAGGSLVANTNTAAVNGWVPTSGTIELTDLSGATNLNVTFAGSNTEFSVSTQTVGYGSVSGSSQSVINVCANGKIYYESSGNGFAAEVDETFTPNTKSNPDYEVLNSWLNRQAGDCSSSVGGLYEVLFVKTGGTSLSSFTNNNTWVRLNTNRSQSVFASVSGAGSSTTSIRGRMKFRRYDTQVELANVYIELSASVVVYSGPAP